ncbi:exported hypothetical protein [Candidatus Sulfopaludibacter sp. SbA4]|nr:exported hypothetical protein [Candidatus Sulfopaludibacter sp. SbA4]
MHTTTANSARTTAKRPRAAKEWLSLLLLVVLLIAPHHTRSQTSTPASSGSPAPLPQRVVYWQFFKFAVLLDVEADQADQRGENGNHLRNYYQTKTGMTAAETALLKSTANSTVKGVHAIDQQIQAAVVSYRGQFRKGTPPPPLPPELQTLQTQKDNLILNGLAAIQAGFGAARFQNLDAFVQKDIAPHITLSTVKPLGPSAANGTLPPGQPVPWP